MLNRKALEKALAKEVGIARSAVKKVVDELEGSDAVHAEKVGVSTYYWKFASERTRRVETELAEERARQVREEKAVAAAQRDLAQARAERVAPDRAEKLAQMDAMEKQLAELNSEISKFATQCDSRKVAEMATATRTAYDAAERWTDVVFAIAKVVKDRKGMPNGEFFKKFGLPPDFDYLEHEHTPGAAAIGE